MEAYLDFNDCSQHKYSNFPKFASIYQSNLNHRREVSAVELSFRGPATEFDTVVKTIVNYAYLRYVRKLSIEWFRFSDEVYSFPQCLFTSHTLKHLTLSTHYFLGHGLHLPKSAWDFPALETLNLSNMQLTPFLNITRSLDLFSKCVNLKDLTLHRCAIYGLEIFYVCAPQLSNLTITYLCCFPKVFNLVAPQLKNLTASVNDSSGNFLQLSTEGLDSLEKVNLCMSTSLSEKERYAPRILDLFHKLRSAKFLILDKNIIEVLSACLDQLLGEPCPFNNLRVLKQKDHTPIMPTEIKNYLLERSPNATFVTDLPQVPHNRLRQEVDDSIKNQQTETIDEEKIQLEKKIQMQDETIAEHKAKLEAMKVQHEKKMLKEKIEMQDKIIAEQKVMLETMKLKHENEMLEKKMQMQDKFIEEQNAMLEMIKLQNEKRMFEAKIEKQDKIIAEKKAMLEAMKLQQEN